MRSWNQEQFRKELGIIEDGFLHFNNAGAIPLAGPARRSIEKVIRELSEEGYFQREALFEVFENARKSIALFLGAQAEELSFTSSCSEGLSHAANGLPLKKGRDKIISFAEEYPSNVYPWRALAERKSLFFERIPFEDPNVLREDSLLEAIDEKTHVVAVSWVQFQNGAVADINKISERCKEVGAWLVVDVIQAAGILPFSFNTFGADMVAMGTHKWLMGPLGAGLLLTRKDLFQELSHSLHGALSYGLIGEPVDLSRAPHLDGRCFEPGTPNIVNIVAIEAVCKWISDWGVENINKAAIAHSSFLRNELKKQGHFVYEPNLNKKTQHPIVTFKPRCGQDSCSKFLATKRVSFAQRLDGIRVAPHAFNTQDELGRFLDFFKET